VIYDYNNADYDSIYNFLLNDLFLTNPCFNDGETADQTWEKFLTPIHKAIELFVPTKIVCPPVRVSRRSKYRPRHIRRALNKKRHLWRLHCKNKTLLSKSQYEKQSAYVKKLIFDYQKQTEQSFIKQANLGTFYRFINSKLSCKSGVGPLKSPSGDITIDGPEKAELLNNYFASIFTVDDGKLPLFNQRVKNDVFMSHVDFSSCDIAKVIANLKNTRTVDLHGFNNIFIKCLRFVLAKPLSMIYSYILFHWHYS